MREPDARSAMPIACTLDGHELKARFAEIAALADRALLSHRQNGRTLRLRFAFDAAAQLERLVDQERQCGFLQFDLRTAADAVLLDITAPAEAGDFAPLLYARFIGQATLSDHGCGPCCAAGRPGPASHD